MSLEPVLIAGVWRQARNPLGAFSVPQRRRRLILMAGRGFRIHLPQATGESLSVRMAIGDLPVAGQSGDPAHDHGESRSPKVRKLIRCIPRDGGSRMALGEANQLECHRRVDGFKDVFGRMAWDDPAPTITSGSVNPSKGRFLHPTEDRSITLREAALLQTFPATYKLAMNRGKHPNARFVGEAIPPALARIQGMKIKEALRRRLVV
ncbi:MAG: DNA cytosine methyltransferase [Truepera sp.]|nr:DNA cytosine methyltransferase [Truepera sp.]